MYYFVIERPFNVFYLYIVADNDECGSNANERKHYGITGYFKIKTVFKTYGKKEKSDRE
jgi:hypothetical protein